MPPATLAEYYLYQAHYLKARNGGTDYAVVWTNAAAAGIGRDAAAGANDYASAIVNVLQGLGFVGGGQVNISASYVPTEKCLGMAKMRQFRRIYNVAHGGAIEYRQLTGDPPWNAAVFNPMVGGLAASPCDRLDGFLLNPNAHLQAAGRALGLAQVAPVVPLVPPQDWVPVLPVHGRRVPPPLVTPDPPSRPIQPRDDATSDIRNELLITLAFACVDASYGAAGGPAGRRIGCVLVDANDNLLAAGVNSANHHMTLHGETTLMTAYVTANNQLPNHCRLYTTLEPCHMCSGMLYDTAFGHNIRVYYGQNDPSIVNSVLSRMQKQFELPVGSDIVGDVINVGIDRAIPRLTDVLEHADTARSFGTAVLKYRKLRDRLRAPDERAIWLQGWSLLHRLNPALEL